MPQPRHRGEYPKDWPAIAKAVKDEARWCCERCGEYHNPREGRCLTVHHFDGDKANCSRGNLMPLCQACHLSVQARVDPEIPLLFVSWTVRLLRKAKAGKILVAFSDSDAGEIGTIYQACGWTFIGAGSSVSEWVSPAGKVHNQAMIGRWIKEKGGTWAAWCEALRRDGWREQPSNPKGRYVQILDERDSNLRSIVDRLRRPYPKRVGSIAGDATVHQTGEGGSSPTSTL